MKILRPIPNARHNGDTFRELLAIWERDGLCEVEQGPDDFTWVGEVGDVLLYEYPRLDDRKVPQFNYCLFGNTVPMKKATKKWTPWVFWGRRPMLMEEIVANEGVSSYEKRDIGSMFLGKVENEIQFGFRAHHEMPINGEYKHSQYEYLQLVNRSRFGLCLRGYGPKCNREVELFCMGTVPIVTSDVDMTYLNPPLENVHYLRINGPDEFRSKIASIDEEQWKLMSAAGRKWYEDNCSPSSSFRITKELVDGYYASKQK